MELFGKNTKLVSLEIDQMGFLNNRFCDVLFYPIQQDYSSLEEQEEAL